MSLADKSLRAIRSNYIGTLVRVVAQFGAQIIIMRALGPESVGVFGYALLLYGVLGLVIDQGFGWSLVKGDFNNNEQIAVAFSRVMLASCLAVAIVYLASFPIEEALGNQLVGDVFRHSAPSYLLVGLFVVAQARLRADLRFKEIQFATTGAYVVAYPIVGIYLALHGYGVWALLIAWYTQALLQVAIAYYFNPHSLMLTNPFKPTPSGPLGRSVAGINILNWAVDGSGGIVVGSFGATALGNFNAAAMLAKTPAIQLVQVLQTVLFSTASALDGDRRNIRRLYLAAIASIGMVVVPAYSYASTHAGAIIAVVFGDKWLHATGIFASLSPGMIALSLGSISAAILTASGDQRITLYSQLMCLLVMITGLYLTANLDLVFVGAAISLAYWLRFSMQLRAICKSNNISVSEIVGVAKGPMAIALLMAAPLPDLFPSAGMIQNESIEIMVKLALVALLLRVSPEFFICPSIAELLQRFEVGRNVLRLLRLQ